MRSLGPLARAHRKATIGQFLAQLVIVDDPSHRLEHFGVVRVPQAPAAEHPGLIERSTTGMNHDRGPNRVGLEDNVTEGLGEKRRNDDRAGSMEQPGQPLTAEKALEMDVREAASEFAERLLVGSRTRNSQVDLGQVPHQRDQPLESLHADEAPGGGQIRPFGHFRLFIFNPRRPVVGQEVR